MARAKKREADATGPAASDAAAFEAPAADNRNPDLPPWREDTWAGSSLYSCRRCPFSTLDIGRIRSHRCELPIHAR